MSKQLEQILDLLLNENHEQAEQMFHDYMVSKARSEYQRQLDEEEHSDDDKEEHEEEIDSETEGLQEEEDEDDEAADDEGDEEAADDEGEGEDLEAELDSEEEPEDGEDEDEDVEDRVDDLEDDLAQLQAEFDRLMSGEEDEPEFGDDMEDGEMIDQGGDFEDDVAADAGYGDEEDFDLDDPALAEATNFQDKAGDQPMKGSKLKGSEADNEESPFSKVPGKQGRKEGAPVKIDSKDGEKEVKHEKPKSSRYDGVDNRLKTVKPEQKSSKQPMKKGGGSED